jgi:hypothetical protein
MSLVRLADWAHRGDPWRLVQRADSHLGGQHVQERAEVALRLGTDPYPAIEIVVPPSLAAEDRERPRCCGLPGRESTSRFA